MSTPAKVHSTEAIEAVRLALLTFAERVNDALSELSAEMRRMMEWLEHDRPRFWKLQMRRGMDQVHEAQQALHRCLMFPIADERPSCYEERDALKKAQARLTYCQEKTERVRHWQSRFQQELFEYEGRISQLVRVVEVDVPQAIGLLTKIIGHLDEYQSGRLAQPRAAYDEVAMTRAIWAEDEVEAAASEGEAVAETGPENDSADQTKTSPPPNRE